MTRSEVRVPHRPPNFFIMPYLENIIGVIVGLAVIKYSNEIAGWLGDFVGTNIFRDLDNPFVIKIVGFVIVVLNLVVLVLYFT